MTRQRKLYHAIIMSDQDWDARYPDGRRAAQVTAAIWTTSKKKAAEAMGGSLYWFNDYGNVGWPDAEMQLVDIPTDVLMIQGISRGGNCKGPNGVGRGMNLYSAKRNVIERKTYLVSVWAESLMDASERLRNEPERTRYGAYISSEVISQGNYYDLQEAEEMGG